MLAKLKRIAEKVLKWTVGISLIAAIVLVLALPRTETIRPHSPSDLKKVIVQILSSETSGTGTILRSPSDGSEILTNRHVCLDSKRDGGLIISQKKRYRVVAIKPSPTSDLCLMKIEEDLYVEIVVSDSPAPEGERVLMGGHPLSMPMVVQEGFAFQVINMSDDPMKQEFGLLTSVLVQPGHSGSGLFDSKGELVGVMEAFRNPAQNDSIGFGIAVPQQYIKRFLQKEAPKAQWIKVPR